ncbi:MAG: AraC family transcriptional regulator [bacterium]|nr:AraC family transcriptional regulator [bacterium]
MQEQLLAVQHMQDYIEKHVNENVTLEDLSRVSLFSPWYAYRLFKEYTDYTPGDYIRRLKLSKSALRLRDENCRIIDVAYDMGFQSVDGYQRAFAREFGCNPSEYAKNPIPLPLFISYGVIYDEIRKEHKKMENRRSVMIQQIHKPARKALIMRAKTAKDYFTYCEEVGRDVWGYFTSIRSISGEPVSMWLPKEYIKEGTSEYVQGVELPVDYDGGVQVGFDMIELPEADYLMFQGEPFQEEDYIDAIEEIEDAIERYQPSVIGMQWDESNPYLQLEPVGKRGYIEMKAVKPL